MPQINITEEQRVILHEIRMKLKERFKRPVYYSEVVSFLLENSKKLDSVKTEINRLRGVIEDIARKPVFFGNTSMTNVATIPAPSFSPPPQLPPPHSFAKPVQYGVKKGEGRVLGNENTRVQLMQEMNTLFREGVKLKPVGEAIAEDISEGVITIETVMKILENPDKGVREIMVEYIMLVRKALQSHEMIENIDKIFSLDVVEE